MDCPIPIDLNVQKHWRNHRLVTDDMVAWLKKACGCEPYEKLRDISAKEFERLFEQAIPEGKVCWEKVDMREGAFQPLAPELVRKVLIFTDENGRNPCLMTEFAAMN